MKKKRVVIGLIIIGLAAIGILLYRKQPWESQERGVYYGNVDIREARLAFQLGGRVEEVYFNEGEAVEPGELLAQLDAEPYRIAVKRAEAQLAAARARLQLLEQGYRVEDRKKAEAQVSEAATRLRNAERNLNRQKALYGDGASTEQNYDDALAARDQASASLKVAEANLEQMLAGFRTEEIAEAQSQTELAVTYLNEAQLNLRYTRLHAPAGGIILTRSIEKGEMTGNQTPAFVLSVKEPSWVRAYLPEPDLGLIEPGMEVAVYSDTRPDQPYRGHIGFISPKAEFTPKTVQTEDLRADLIYRFRVILDDADSGLRQGMPVTVKLQADQSK